MSLVPVDSTSEVAVIAFLESGVAALNEALDRTDIAGVVNIKAQAATIETATKQLQLSQESQDSATELVRRSEWTLGRAIKKGQTEGAIRSHGGSLIPGARTGGLPNPSSSLPSPKEFFSSQTEYEDVTAIAKADEDELTETLAEAREEGNTTRTNVARKIRERHNGTARSPQIRDDRAELIRNLAEQGYSSRQMPSKVGVTETSVRQIARDYDIEIPADKYVSRTRRIDSNRLVENTATALEGLISGIELINYDDVDPAMASQWADSLKNSVSKLRSFANQIDRKATQ